MNQPAQSAPVFAATPAPAPRGSDGAASADPAPGERPPAHTLFTRRQRAVMLAVLFCVQTCNTLDAGIVQVLVESIKIDFKLSDTQIGLLTGFSFSLFYAIAGIPIARWADRGNRRTVIAVCLTTWSVMTAVCGLAQNFVQLLLARVGVGAGEAGSVGPSQSLIADYFPPEKRTGALAVMTSSYIVGGILAFVVGAQLAATHGWRTAMFAAAVPGLVVVLLVRLVLKEPRDVIGYPAATVMGSTDLRSTLRVLWRKPSYRLLLMGIALFTFAQNGIGAFGAAYAQRVLNIPLQTVGALLGLVVVLSALTGAFVGGWLGNKLSRRDVRWQVWMPGAAVFLCFPLYLFSYTINNYYLLLSASFVITVLLYGAIPSIFAAVHAICGSQRRALAMAFFSFTISLLGSGLGPLVVGALSDALTPQFGVDGLRYAILIVSCAMPLCGLTMWRAGLRMPTDVEA